MKKIYIILLTLCLGSTAVIAQVNSFEIDSTKFDKKLKLSLDSLFEADQAIRLKVNASFQHKDNKVKTDSLLQLMRQQDLINLTKTEHILTTYGWLGPQKVGMNASQALFLVIQHAALPVQEKYLPIIKQAVDKGETLSSNLALLEDRILMRQGKKQLYGSQSINKKGVSYIYPIEDPDHLDERRKKMGLSPMIEYNKSWDLEAHKRDLPEIEKAVKQ